MSLNVLAQSAIIKKQRLQREYDAMRKVMQDYVDSMDKGNAGSLTAYNIFKDLLEGKHLK